MTHSSFEHAERIEDRTAFGFWLYVMSDCVLFATLFATYFVLQGNTAGGPGLRELVSLPYVLGETLLLLTSSFTCGLALLFLYRGHARPLLIWLSITILLGAGFLALEVWEFRHLMNEGHGPAQSGFLSAFFTLIGTHGLHVSAGILWMLFLCAEVVRTGLTASVERRILCASIFWHFLDIVWICIFSLVYLFGAI